ncbi:MAG: GNAT family N-acetyltransferase [Bacteroidaceae bacterium]|nr:GNAT family N-acetyltransferase [Bacteroidaceae bacterium]
MRQFINFPERLYRDCPQWVPPLNGDEYDTLSKKNTAFEYCEMKLFLAEDDSKGLVGRVAAIINHRANDKWNEKNVRFGWIDFVNDIEVARALIDSVEKWGVSKGMTHIKGPLGFTDFDKEGMLVEGYEHLSPFTCIYNYPYYNDLLQQLGFVKDVDWTQKIVTIPEELPSAFKFVNIVEERFGIHAVRGMNMREMCRRYGMQAFHLINESFAQLYEYAPFSDEQIRRYLKTYVPILDPDFVCILVDSKDEVVGFGFCVPTLSTAVKKSRGRLFPFGLLRILYALKHNDTLEALVIGIKPEYQGKGAVVLLLEYLHKNCIRRGIRKMIVNPQLEDNVKVQTLFSGYETKDFMRRRSYTKEIDNKNK